MGIRKWPIAVFSVFFSACLLVGRQIYDTNSFPTLVFPDSLFDVIVAILSFAGLSLLVAALTSLLMLVLLRTNERCSKKAADRTQDDQERPDTLLHRATRFFVGNKRVWLMVWVVIFLAWLPCYLAYYPGVLSYDMDSQSKWVITGDWSSHHPPLHTFIWSVCWSLGNALAIEPIIIYSFAQMIFLSFCCARLFRFFQRREVGPFWLVVTVLFFAINPIVALFSFIPTKDVVFAGSFLLLLPNVIRLLVAASNGSVKTTSWFSVFLLTLVCCLLRNNFVYAVAIFCVICVFLFKRQQMAVSSAFAASVLLFALISGPLFSLWGIQPGGVKEALSVPIQQIAKVVSEHEDELPEELLSRIDELVPLETIEQAYNPRFSDPIKSHFTRNTSSVSFFELWARIGCQYPAEYLEAFLDLNIPYWYPGAAAVDPFSQRDYIETFVYKEPRSPYTFERQSLNADLLRFYESIADASALDGIPGVSTLCALSTPLWLMLLALVFFLVSRNRCGAVYMLLPLLFWATFLFGPVSNFRYIFSLFCCYPLFVVSMVRNLTLPEKP